MQKIASVCLLWWCAASIELTGCFLLSRSKGGIKTTADLITSNGYPVESHLVTTQDSYVITMQRIPAGRAKQMADRKTRKPVVLLMSGLEGSSADYVVNLPHQSLGFILPDHGFDVWLGNVRGNKYSNHLHLRKTDEKFWNFSLDEMISYDLPAQIDYVLNKTRQSAMQYVGWSQGCGIMLGLLAEKPKYNEKIRLFHAMAPAALLGHMKSFLKFLVPFSEPGLGAAQFVFKGSVLGKGGGRLLQKIKKAVCRANLPLLSCWAVFYIFNGGLPVELNRTRLPVYMEHSPAGASIRTVRHFAQLVKSKNFQKFDWGREKNMKMYGHIRPPLYKLRKVKAPVAIYWGDGDVLTTPVDVADLKSRLPKVVLMYKVPVPGFTHIDFGWSVKAKDHLYIKMTEMMKAYSGVQ